MRKTKTQKAKGPNMKIVGLFIFCLIGLTVLLLSQSTKPCVLDVPNSSSFVFDDAMIFANSRMTSLRVIYVERVIKLGGTLPFFGSSLVSIPDQGIQVVVDDVNKIAQLSYPFADLGLTVNVLSLQDTPMTQLAAKIGASKLKIAGVESGVNVYVVSAYESNPASSNPSLTNAYVALAGSNLYYVEGHQFAYQMLTYTIHLGLKGDGSFARTEMLMKAYVLVTQGVNNLVGYSYTPYTDQVNRVAIVLKAVGVDSSQVISRQVLVFETQSQFDQNVDSAKGTFLNKNEQACNAGQYLVGNQPLPLDNLRAALQGL